MWNCHLVNLSVFNHFFYSGGRGEEEGVGGGGVEYQNWSQYKQIGLLLDVNSVSSDFKQFGVLF